MSKKDYLDSLRESLSYELPSRLVESNIRFYESYIEEQLRSGKSFQEIEEELGEPQLIARSCIDAAKSGADGIPNSGDDPDFSQEIERESSQTKESTGTEENDTKSGQNKTGGFRVVSGSGCLITILILVTIIICLIAFFTTPVGLTILAGLLIAGLIFRLFKR